MKVANQPDWDKPIMLDDGTWARKGRQRSTDWWVDCWDDKYQLIRPALFTASGKHIPYKDDPKRLPDVTNRPPVNMEGALYWLDNSERTFVRERFYGVTGEVSGYSVDDTTGRLYHVNPDGIQSGLPPRVLGNVPLDLLQAEAKVAIKRAQLERAQRREQEALDRLADLNPTLFGAF